MEENNKRLKDDKNVMEIFFIIIIIILIIFLIVSNIGKLNNFIPTGYVDIFDLHFANAPNTNNNASSNNQNNNNNYTHSQNNYEEENNNDNTNNTANSDITDNNAGENTSDNNTGNNNNNNDNDKDNENKDDNSDNDDNKEDEDKKDENLWNNRVDVYDDKIIYQNNEAEIFRHSAYYILDGKIAPTSQNSYQFIVRNGNSFNVKYNLIMKEKNDYNINMKFRLKKNGKYVIGNDNNWVTADEIKKYEIVLANNSYDTYTLDWYWFEGENDTEIGTNIESKYKLYIGIYAEQY